ncbi:hypothetical protein P4H83_01325 [Paenibacillus favisporus]|uniref:hypothetical protein n=1 Tax=Paenibacillus favisporus TaxID=221028 RepID=UPI002DB7F3C8|nr:hypothetical protein [Paenibacillus favisporus]MEC0173506.1 hypothetical protein [Paenibacillus favisporus]
MENYIRLALRGAGRLFAEEKLLAWLGVVGFVLAAGIAAYIGMFGPVVPPEGNVASAFSFNAAIGVFMLSIAMLLPLSSLKARARTAIRRVFVPIVVYAYAVETIQHFRGVNPRFSQSGSIIDTIAGTAFGLASFILIIVTTVVAVAFFRRKLLAARPLLIIGIRYSFVSVTLSFAAGLWMIALNGRFTGAGGNIIVLHGLGFHALQVLPLLGWLLERSRAEARRAQLLLHTGSAAWIVSVAAVAVQTAAGRTIFEWSALPVVAAAGLLLCLASIAAAAGTELLKPRFAPAVPSFTDLER